MRWNSNWPPDWLKEDTRVRRDDDEIVAQELLRQPSAFARGLPLLELIDEIDEVEPPRARLRMTSAATAMQRWVLPVPVPPIKMMLRLASRMFLSPVHAPVPDRRACRWKTKLSRSPTPELGAADAVTDRPSLAVRALGPDQAGDEGIDLVATDEALAGDLVEAGAHAVELELAHGVENLMALHQASFLMLS